MFFKKSFIFALWMNIKKFTIVHKLTKNFNNSIQEYSYSSGENTLVESLINREGTARQLRLSVFINPDTS